MRTASAILRIAIISGIVLASLACANTAPKKSEEALKARADWRPPELGLGEWDWVRLTSDEWLKGEIIVLRKDSLEFDSDKLNKLTTKWKDVKEIYSKRTNSFLFGEDTRISGGINLRGNVATITDTAGKKHEFPRQELQTIIPGQESEGDYWSGKVTLGVSVRSGNTDQLEYSFLGDVARRTLDSRLSLSYNGGYSEVNGDVTLNSHRLNAALDYYLTRQLYVTPIAIEFFRDPLTNIDRQITPSVGAGYTIVDTSDIEWDVNTGLGYQYTQYVSVPEGEDDELRTGSVRIGTTLEYEITDDIDLDLDYRLSVGVPETESRQHHFLTQISFEITDDIDFDVTFLWDRVIPTRKDADGNKPVPDDFRLSVGIGIDF